MDTEHKLLQNSLILVQSSDTDFNLEDILLGDDNTMASIANIMRESGDALKSVIKVINAEKMRKLVMHANPIEVVPIRHEIVGAEEVLERIEKYADIYARRENKKGEDKTPRATP